MKTGLQIRAIATAFALLLTLSACGGKAAESSLSASESAALTESVEAAPQASGGFDAPVVTPDKVSYMLSLTPRNHFEYRYHTSYSQPLTFLYSW